MTLPTYVAELIIDELNIKDLNDLQLLQEVAFQRNAIIRYKPLKTAEARLIIGQPYSIIVVSTTVKNPYRRRFSVAQDNEREYAQRPSLYIIAVFSPSDLSIYLWMYRIIPLKGGPYRRNIPTPKAGCQATLGRT